MLAGFTEYGDGAEGADRQPGEQARRGVAGGEHDEIAVADALAPAQPSPATPPTSACGFGESQLRVVGAQPDAIGRAGGSVAEQLRDRALQRGSDVGAVDVLDDPGNEFGGDGVVESARLAQLRHRRHRVGIGEEALDRRSRAGRPVASSVHHDASSAMPCGSLK